MKPIRHLGVTLLLGLAAIVPALAAPPINTYGEGGGLFSDPPRTGVAIRGYDPVAYFTDAKPVKGSDPFAFDWMGARWMFANQDHLDRFKADPAKYAPQYGGYCAYGIAVGNVVKIEPEQWSIVDGRLYLNYDDEVSRKWKKDPAGYIRKADAGFQALIRK